MFVGYFVNVLDQSPSKIGVGDNYGRLKSLVASGINISKISPTSEVVTNITVAPEAQSYSWVLCKLSMKNRQLVESSHMLHMICSFRI